MTHYVLLTVSVHYCMVEKVPVHFEFEVFSTFDHDSVLLAIDRRFDVVFMFSKQIHC